MADPKVDPPKLQHAAAVLPPLPVGATPSGKSRLQLHLQAETWRHLMDIGMHLHKLAPPWVRGPDFKRKLPVTVSPTAGEITLYFYVPEGYREKKESGERMPVVTVFHGGGFTIGRATDDVRWCRAVTSQLGAIAVAVEYRCAPEYPFPTGVEDGVDALLWLAQHASELGIDAQRICVSGFSAGGNMAFSVPLRLHSELLKRRSNPRATGSNAPEPPAAEPRVVAICAWYPSTDFTRPRSERRKTNTRPEKELPKFFTDLFDASYLYPSANFSLDSPYLSPGVAPTQLLREGLPEDIIILTCEWDELLAEGRAFAHRLEEEVGKRVHYHLIKGVGHGFDKGPNPVWRDRGIDRLYEEACGQVGRAFSGEGVEKDVEHAEPSAASSSSSAPA